MIRVTCRNYSALRSEPIRLYSRLTRQLSLAKKLTYLLTSPALLSALSIIFFRCLRLLFLILMFRFKLYIVKRCMEFFFFCALPFPLCLWFNNAVLEGKQFTGRPECSYYHIVICNNIFECLWRIIRFL